MISIIMPAFEQQERIAKAMDSVPFDRDVELIVIDDASCDDTVDVVETYMLEHPDKRIILLKNVENIGCGMSINRGLEFAKGKYWTQLDSDDWYLPEIGNVFDMVNMGILDDGLVCFDLETTDGSRLRSMMDKNLCDHFCLYRRDLAEGLRMPNLRHGAGWFYHRDFMRREPTIAHTNLVAYHWSYPREGSIMWQVENGLLE